MVALENIKDEIQGLSTIEDAENFAIKALNDVDDDEVIALIESRIDEIKSDGRERIRDSFHLSDVKILDEAEDGAIRFSIIAAQAERTNKNKRFYPREEFEKNLVRVNRLAKNGYFRGKDGHDDFFGPSKPSDTIIKWESISLVDDNLYMSGLLLPTQAGKQIATLWKHGVASEWSIVGYGDAKEVEDEKGNVYYRIENYVLDGCDCVDRGAAETKTIKIHKSDDTHQEAQIMENKELDQIEDKAPLDPVEEPAEKEVVKVDAPEIDREELKAEARKEAERIVAAKELSDAKKKAVAEFAGSDNAKAIFVKQIDRCESVEEVEQAIVEIAPLIDEMKAPKSADVTGIHIGDEKEKYWTDGALKGTDRPETVSEVKQGLLEGIEDNGLANASNKRWIFERILDNYERNHPEYFWACTKRGYREAATTTTALGTQLPHIMPLVRQVFPMLIPYEIASVQPLDRPNGRVYFLDFIYGSGDADGSGLDDSASFDTSYFDHTEGETKGQIALSFTHEDLVAEDKSIYYNVTSNLIQDMRATQGLDAEVELIAAARDQIAREINMEFIEMLAGNAGINAGTFGTESPASGWDSGDGAWLSRGFSMWVGQASRKIAEKFGVDAGWVITTPTVAGLFSASTNFEAEKATGVGSFGYGIRRVGVYNNQLTVYQCAWGSALTSLKNKILFGFYPPEWKYSGAVYAPYIPLYLSPQDSDAATNTLSRSVTTRAAMEVLQPNAYSIMTVAAQPGTIPAFTD